MPIEVFDEHQQIFVMETVDRQQKTMASPQQHILKIDVYELAGNERVQLILIKVYNRVMEMTKHQQKTLSYYLRYH